MNLPSELLCLIFKYAYLLAYDNDPDLAEDHGHLTWNPYIIFSICKRWRDVAKQLPLYATRVMIYIDEPLPMEDLERQIALSKPKRIKVFVVRKEYHPRFVSRSPVTSGEDKKIEESQRQPDFSRSSETLTDPLEKSRIIELMPLLADHFCRCQVLVFDLLLRSSLPCLSQFCGYATRLRTLRLKSHIVDSLNRDPTLTTANLRPVICSNLQYLDLDGAIFIRAVKIPKLLQSIRALSKKEVVISNLFSGDSGAFDLYDLLSALSQTAIGHLKSLKLCNIHLDATRCQQLDPIRIFVQDLELIALPTNVLAGFFAAHTNIIKFNFIRIRDCDLTAVDPFVSWELGLYDIDQKEDITNFVRNWDGFSLRVEDCPSVNDGLLQMMIEYETDEAFYVPSCRQISISPFHNLSAQPLKDLISGRAELAERLKPRPDLYPTYYKMHALWLTGAGPSLSETDRVWFNEQLNTFVWYTSKAGFESPVLDEDCAEWDNFPEGFPSSSPIDAVSNSEDVQIETGKSSMEVVCIPQSPDSVGFASPLVAGDYSDWSIENLSHISE